MDQPLPMHSLKSQALDDTIRMHLKMDPSLGAGNFLHKAYETNPNPHVPLVFTNTPYETFAGETHTAFSLEAIRDICLQYAQWYHTQGVLPKDPVGVYLEEGVGYLMHYVALTTIGAIPILVNGNMAPAVASGHLQRVGAVGLFTDASHLKAIKEALPNSFGFVNTVRDIGAKGTHELPNQYPYQHNDLDPIMITHSSGTTGVPKAVLLQHGKWFHGIRELLGLEKAQGTYTYLSVLPSSHNAAIAYAMHAILNGSNLVIMSERNPHLIAQAISQYQPSTVVSFPENFVALAEMDLSGYNLDSVSTWINSGDAAHETHIRRLVAHGHHIRGNQTVEGSQFIDGLGSSEMGHSSFRIIHTSNTQNYGRCVGIPQRWVEAKALDQWGHEKPKGAVGMLGIKSPSVTSGYWNNSLLTHRSRLNGYWLTGDLVYQDQFGAFYHVDRITDAIQTRSGVLYSLLTEERLMSQFEAIGECTIIGVEGSHSPAYSSAIAFVTLREGQQISAEALKIMANKFQRDQQCPEIDDIVLIGYDQIPVGVTGKVLKAQLRKRYQAQMPLSTNG